MAQPLVGANDSMLLLDRPTLSLSIAVCLYLSFCFVSFFSTNVLPCACCRLIRNSFLMFDTNQIAMPNYSICLSIRTACMEYQVSSLIHQPIFGIWLSWHMHLIVEQAVFAWQHTAISSWKLPTCKRIPWS